MNDSKNDCPVDASMAFVAVAVSSDLQILRQQLLQNRQRFIDNFEVSKTIDLLRKDSIISDEEYLNVTSERNRKILRQKIFDILVHKDGNDWIGSFRQILQDTEQTWLILTQETHFADDLDIRIGNTTIIPEDEQYFMRIDLPLAHQADEMEILSGLSTDQRVIQQSISSGIIDIRQGHSIYLYLRPCRPRDIPNIVQIWFKTICERQIVPANTVLNVQVFHKPAGFIIDDHFGEIKNISPSRLQDSKYCHSCLRSTIIEREGNILDQLETDIMEETFQCSENVSEFIKNVCLFMQRPRVLRAKMFLIYVLQNDNVLENFIEIVNGKEFMDLDIVKCEQCRGKGASIIKRTLSTTKLFPFKTRHVSKVFFEDGGREMHITIISNEDDKHSTTEPEKCSLEEETKSNTSEHQSNFGHYH